MSALIKRIKVFKILFNVQIDQYFMTADDETDLQETNLSWNCSLQSITIKNQVYCNTD